MKKRDEKKQLTKFNIFKMSAVIASLLVISLSLCSAFLVNVNVTRKFEIALPVARMRFEIIFQNRDTNPTDSYLFMIDPYITDFYGEFFTENKERLYFSKQYDEIHKAYSVKINLRQPIKYMEHSKIYGEINYMGVIEPLPKKKIFKDPQFIKYSANPYFYSPYKTLFGQALYIKTSKPLKQAKLPHPDLEFYSYENIPPFTLNKTSIVFKNTDMLVRATNVERRIDISHFGRITIKDKITLQSLGSEILGSFQPNIYEIQKSDKYWLKTHLPTSAEDFKLFDSIGYLYKMEVLEFEDHKTLKFQHRYPLLANWKVSYTLSYTVPMYEYLKRDKTGLFHLEIRAIDHILNDIVIDEAKVTILLPEGAQFKSIVNLPTGLTKLEDETTITTLTYFGRPTIILAGKNLVELHVVPVSVYYYMSDIFLYRVPVQISFYIFITFMFFIACRRFDFGLK